MKEGYIKLYRKSLESIIFTSEKGWKIWTWCLLKANHEENSFFLGRTRVDLKPGQFVMGRNTASGELGMAVGTIWYWLDILEKEGNVERKATNKYTVITLPKWKQYQEDNNKLERRLNADRTQIEQQIEPNKNDKNDKNDNKNTESNPRIAEVINLFKNINPSYKGWFGNKVQRKAATMLLEVHGFEKVAKAVSLLTRTNSIPFITTITTPYMLESKWALWENQVRKKMAEKEIKQRHVII